MKKGNIVSNYLYSLIYHIVVAIIPVVTAPYLSRIFGPHGSGLVSYFSSIITYLVLLIGLGTKTYGSRSISLCKNETEQQEVFSSLFYITAIIGSLCTIFWVIYGIGFAKNEYKLVCFAYVPQILSAIFDIAWLYMGREEFKFIATRNTIIKLVTTLGVFLFVKESEDVLLYVGWVSASHFVSSMILWIKKYRKLTLIKTESLVVFSHFRACLFLFIPTIATAIYKSMDKIILGQMSSLSEVGLYAYSEKIPNLLLGFVGALGLVVLPKVSNMIVHEQISEISALAKKTMAYVMFVGCGMAFGVASISKEFAPIFFGNEFEYTGVLMVPVALAMIFTSWACVIRNIFILPFKKDHIVVKAVCFGALINLVIDLLLIPKYGSMGAVVGLVFAEFTIPFVQFLFLFKSVVFKELFEVSMPSIIAGIVIFFVNTQIGTMLGIYVKTVFIQVAVGTLIYLLVFFIFAYLFMNEFTKVIISDISSYLSKKGFVK